MMPTLYWRQTIQSLVFWKESKIISPEITGYWILFIDAIASKHSLHFKVVSVVNMLYQVRIALPSLPRANVLALQQAQ
jgi:hypothetical protein